MSKPVLLSIGAENPHAEAHAPDRTAELAPPEAVNGNGAAAGAEEIYAVLKRHEETLRDLVVEIRLLYHSLSEKEQRLLEGRRDATTRSVREEFAGRVQALEETASRLRAGR